ncbi:hypothetical protein NC652_037482 [Populus alba x Populus x berolinensis]|nr:hypothetical protein NC652_037482 [Populus alba x Populus x berolinensis]
MQTEIDSEIHVTASELCISVINNQPSTSDPICQQNDQPAIQFSLVPDSRQSHINFESKYYSLTIIIIKL